MMSPFVDVLYDCQIGKYHFKTGDKIGICIHNLHHNENEWKRPREFHPERFDHLSDMSLTPKGTKRNSYSWVPFNGGKRICFGKTFADMNLKIMAVYASQYFNWSHTSDKYTKDKFPMMHVAMSETIPIDMKISQYVEERTGCDKQ